MVMKSILTSRGLLSGFYLGLASPMLLMSAAAGQQDSQFLTPTEQDLHAMRSDWLSVGESFGVAIENYTISNGNQEKNESVISRSAVCA